MGAAAVEAQCVHTLSWLPQYLLYGFLPSNIASPLRTGAHACVLPSNMLTHNNVAEVRTRRPILLVMATIVKLLRALACVPVLASVMHPGKM